VKILLVAHGFEDLDLPEGVGARQMAEVGKLLNMLIPHESNICILLTSPSESAIKSTSILTAILGLPATIRYWLENDPNISKRLREIEDWKPNPPQFVIAVMHHGEVQDIISVFSFLYRLKSKWEAKYGDIYQIDTKAKTISLLEPAT